MIHVRRVGGRRYPPPTLLTVRDETPTGRATGTIELEIPSRITLRELIRLRVREEVARHHAHPTERFRSPVRPTETEADLNGHHPGTPTRVDWEEQAGAALTAFGRNGFFVLVADRQVEDLDEELCLDEASEVAFVRLVPLVGG